MDELPAKRQMLPFSTTVSNDSTSAETAGATGCTDAGVVGAQSCKKQKKPKNTQKNRTEFNPKYLFVVPEYTTNTTPQSNISASDSSTLEMGSLLLAGAAEHVCWLSVFVC